MGKTAVLSRLSFLYPDAEILWQGMLPDVVLRQFAGQYHGEREITLAAMHVHLLEKMLMRDMNARKKKIIIAERAPDSGRFFLPSLCKMGHMDSEFGRVLFELLCTLIMPMDLTHEVHGILIDAPVGVVLDRMRRRNRRFEEFYTAEVLSTIRTSLHNENWAFYLDGDDPVDTVVKNLVSIIEDIVGSGVLGSPAHPDLVDHSPRKYATDDDIKRARLGDLPLPLCSRVPLKDIAELEAQIIKDLSDQNAFDIKDADARIAAARIRIAREQSDAPGGQPMEVASTT